MTGLIIALIVSILANLAQTYLHIKEKKDLHDRLMAKSPDEYIYDSQVAPLEVEALKRDFKPEPERTNDTPEKARLKQQIQKQGF